MRCPKRGGSSVEKNWIALLKCLRIVEGEGALNSYVELQQVSYRLAIPYTQGVTEAKKGSHGNRPNNSLYARRKGCPTTQDTEQTLPKQIYLP